MPSTSVTNAQYRALADTRFRIRCFLSFSDAAARAAGIEPQQHQLLLAIRGAPTGPLISVKMLAQRLQIRHHSAVELITRAVAAGLVTRRLDPADGRRVSIHLTRRGATVLERLSRQHRRELRSAGKDLVASLRTLIRTS